MSGAMSYGTVDPVSSLCLLSDILRPREKKRQKESTDPFEDDEVNPYAAQMQ